MHEIFEYIRLEFMSKANLILSEENVEMNEYNVLSGRQKMKNIILDKTLKREEKG